MFRPRNRDSFRNKRPFDPTSLYKLEDLGLFIADDDSIRVQSQTGERYQYKFARATNMLSRKAAELYNDSLWLALSKTLSKLITARLEMLGLFQIDLPARTDDRNISPHTSIFSTLQTVKHNHMLIVFTDGIVLTFATRFTTDTAGGELGVWTGRLISKTSILKGSLEHLVRLFKAANDRAIVIGNLGQIHWHVELKEALTYHQFICASERRLNHATIIPGSETAEAHVATVFGMKSICLDSTSLIVTGASAYATIAFLNSNWHNIKHKLVCLVGIAACFSDTDISEDEFRKFLTTVLDLDMKRSIVLISLEMCQLLSFTSTAQYAAGVQQLHDPKRVWWA